MEDNVVRTSLFDFSVGRHSDTDTDFTGQGPDNPVVRPLTRPGS